MKPRVLFVSRTRYRLPLDEQVARKWDALGEELELRVLATGDGGDDRFHLVPARSPAFYMALPRHVARELRDYRSRLRRLVEPASRAAARAAVRRADAVRTVSAFTAGLVRELGVEPAATFTTYYDASAFTAAPPAPLPERPRALFVGVLERYKNVHVLADAWRRVASALPDVQLHVVGRGREHTVVERLVRDLPQRATWDDWLPSDRIAAALDGATALVLPSVSEGLPRVAMEAFARGRGVVGSRAGGIPDIVEDGVTGILVPPGDAEALAQALMRVLSDRALAQSLADGARADAARWLQTPEQFAARMRALVDEMGR